MCSPLIEFRDPSDGVPNTCEFRLGKGQGLEGLPLIVRSMGLELGMEGTGTSPINRSMSNGSSTLGLFLETGPTPIILILWATSVIFGLRDLSWAAGHTTVLHHNMRHPEPSLPTSDLG
ncbi:hypothetical protein L1987_23182 [Smallanthus sonchifolius]|uniref:Uncharacterized protein n=1 Tax=Smallanthus sonchifolius TaxID=185202 RepID=A0ACB9IHH0_9ASTR|nr:hypothetical protein L1987_23182 [Smallanthus sonchifolius]